MQNFEPMLENQVDNMELVNEEGIKGFPKYLHIISKNLSLQSLVFKNRKIGNKECCLLANALKSNDILEEIDLSSKNFPLLLFVFSF